ncbi:hypothetical protein ABK040_001075 [Willaertia magna]
MKYSRDRTKRYEALLESLPKWAIVVISVVIIIILAVAVIVSLFGSPNAQIHKVNFHVDPDHVHLENNTIIEGATIIYQSLDEVFHGQDPIVDYFYNFTAENMEFKYQVTFSRGKDSFSGFYKSDVVVLSRLFGRDNDKEEWKLLSGVEDLSTVTNYDNYKKTLTCSQSNEWYWYLLGSLTNTANGNALAKALQYGCYPITIFHSRVVKYKQYKMETYIPNLHSVSHAGLLEGEIVSYVESNNPSYTAYELAFRIVFCTLSVIHWLVFIVITFWSQQFTKFHTIQKWLVFLLFLHIFFHDPTYLPAVFSGWEGFPVVNIILSLSFIYGFLLYLLIFFHSLFKPPQERTFLSFYLTKLLIVVSAYILSMIVMIWSRVFNAANPSSVSVNEVPGYSYMFAFNVILLVIYGIDLLYYIVRAIGAVGRMRKKYSTRFWVVGSFSFAVALAMIGVSIAGTGLRTNAQSLSFLVSHTIVYLYFASLSILFLPGANEDVAPIQANNTLQVNDTEHFDQPTVKSNIPVDDEDNIEVTDIIVSRVDDDEKV